MKTPRFPGASASPVLMVIDNIASFPGDSDRGPTVFIRSDDAAVRLLSDGELARIIAERRSELAEIRIDDSLPRGAIMLRDVLGAVPGEILRVIKPDMDKPVSRT